MKWYRIIMPLLFILCMASCQRRPFAEQRTTVSLHVEINTKIINQSDVALPTDMRVDLYDPQTGKLLYTDYVGPTGGYIHPSPGVYDMIVYSIGSDNSLIRFNDLTILQIDSIIKLYR